MAQKLVISSILIALLAILIFTEDYDIFKIKRKTFEAIDILLRRKEVSPWHSTEFLDLATIDMTEAKANSKVAAMKLYKAFSEVGFAYLVNIPDFKPDLLYKYTKWYFDLSLDVKMKIAKSAFRPENKNSYRGYFPVIPGGHSFKEALELGAFFRGSHQKRNAPGTERPLMRDVVQEVNRWPVSGNETEDSNFKDFMTDAYHFYSSVAKEVTHLMAEGLSLGENYFDPLFGSEQLSTLRLLHYPTRINDTNLPEEAKDGDVVIITGEHYDTSFLTVLATFENQGLQVKLTHDGPWLNIPAKKSGLVINVGALLSAMVDGKFKATNHRVIDLGVDRYSVPFFYEMHFDGDISKSISGKEINPAIPKYGPWMTNRTSMFAEYATTDFGVVD